MATKKKIILAPLYDFKFILIGILCQSKDYRLCFEINRILDIDLVKVPSIEIIQQGKKKEKADFSRYEFEQELYVYSVISNKCDGNFLIPEEKQYDYFLMIEGGMREDESAIIKSKLKSSKLILGLYSINPERLKSKENLLF